ncbi:MAG: tRNA (adenosine(37)-N6)-threonylcarbamoyltransferase complex ATPase subunit type 1 TsaE [Bacteroidales bacterium]|jgi:tRNA threonylcarbamoyladenosine biosynthesis protein TsaE|nr:tRNA (adenosine(37)-N6)-threonylcarbamoyltransferase complex ATPase subunit type 1 TsaE [Bacteroidales bacterium]
MIDMTKTYECVDLSELESVARDILSVCKGERVFVLEGGMGAGKTTFTKALCSALGCEDNVCSPTFAIVNVYFSEKVGEVYHFDFYRLEDVSEAHEIGIEEYFYSGGYCFLEWSERVSEILPPRFATIKIDVVGEKQRTIIFNS